MSGSTVTFTSGTGTCVVDANQAGDTNYNAAPQTSQTITLGKASQAITFTSSAPTPVAVLEWPIVVNSSAPVPLAVFRLALVL